MSGDSERESTNRVEPAALLFNKYVDADAFFSDALAVIQSTALASQQLPPRGEAFDYYQSFPRFADGMFISRVRLVSSINKLVRKFTSCRPLDAPTDPKLVDNKTTKSKREAAQREEEQMERIIEINDEITERINNQLDVICGLSKAKPVTPSARRKVVSSLQRAQNPAARFSANKDAGKKMRTGLCVVSIPKPQLNFKDKVDNKSNLQFVHRLTQKPHAIVPLHPILCKQLENPITEETIRQFPEILRHPYEAEIEAFNLTKDRLTPCVVSDTLKFTKDFQFVNDEISFDRMLITAEFSSKEIAMDLEHHDLRSFMGFTCLIQLSTRTSDYVIDAIEIRHVLHKLNRLTANPRILKVFHGSEMDVLWLQKDFGVYVVNMFDTHQAARLLNHPYLSLSYLLKHYCDFEAAKQYQRADWRQRPLPDVLLEYARADTHFLLYIYDRMRNELIERANGSDRLIRAVYERSKQICLSLFEKPRLRQESAYIASFNARQNQALKLLSEWRDRTAREDDESPEYILPKHMMLKIAEYLPKEKQGIFGCCNPVPAYIRQNLVQIHQLVLDARCVPLEPVSKRGQVADDRFLKLPTYDLDNPTECMFDSAHCDDQPIGRTLNTRQNLKDLLKNVRQMQTVKNEISLMYSKRTQNTASKFTVDFRSADKSDVCHFEHFHGFLLPYLPLNHLTKEERRSIEKWTLLSPTINEAQSADNERTHKITEIEQANFDRMKDDELIPIKHIPLAAKKRKLKTLVEEEGEEKEGAFDYSKMDYRKLGSSKADTSKTLGC